MSYVVEKQSDSQVQSLRSDPVRTRGPYPESIPDAVYSTFKLYPPSDGVSKYRVLLEQTKEDRSNTFLLYESAQFEDAQEQFAKIHKTLKPLVEDGVVMLSNYLLTMFDFEDTELTPSELLDVTGEDAPHEEYLLYVRDGQIQLQPTAATGSSGMPAQRPMHKTARAMPRQQPAQRQPRANPGRKQRVMAQQQPMQTEMVASNQSTPPPTAQYLLCVGNGQIQLQPTAATGSSVGDSVGAPMRKSLASKRAINVGAPPPLPPQTHPPAVGLSLKPKKPTELEAAFNENNYDYYRQLLERGKSLSKPADGSKDDSNYLHFAAEREEKKKKKAQCHKFITSASNYIFQIQKSKPGSHQIEDFRMALNAKNKKGFTPLMLAVRKQHVESALALLLAGADPDIPDRDGYTPLHHATQLGNPELVRLLVVFFADLKDVDKLLKMADPAPGSDNKEDSLCVKILKEMKMAAGSNESATVDSKSIPDDSTPDGSTPDDSTPDDSTLDDSTFLLSLDGGSIKCVITIQILLHLAKRMKEIQKQQGNGDPVHLQSYFDYMAGTSAGSFIVLGLRYCNNFTLEICRAASFKVSQEVMSSGPTFDSEVMERNLKEIVGGEDLTMTSSESEKQRVIITTVQGDKDPPVLHLLCNYARPPPETPKERRKPIPLPSDSETEEEIPLDSDEKKFLSSERKVWEAARASSAAPYYFDPFKKRLIDGGVMANNPTLDSLMEIFRQGKGEGKTVNIGLVLSIGTGIPIAKQLKDVGVHRPRRVGDFFKTVIKVKGNLSGLANLFDQFLSQCTRSDGQEVERADAWCEAMGARYVRLSPELSRNYEFEETDSVTLTKMMYEGHIYALEQRQKIDQVARLLLKRVPIKQPK